MSAKATAWAWEQDVPAPEKVVLLALADEAKDDGVVHCIAQADIAAKVGAAERTVRSNLAKLTERGLILREPQFESRRRIADRIELHLVPADVAAEGTIRRADTSTSSANGEEKKDGGARQNPPADALDAVELPDSMRVDARDLLRQKRKVDGHLVTVEEMARAAAALAAFNRCSGSEYGLGAHLRPLVMRVRERPSWDGPKLVRLVESAWRLRWWEKQRNPRGGRVGVQVVFGNERVFEQVAQDAADEAAGKPLDTSAPTAAKRFTRSD
jgi:hypothetical protein